MSRRWVSARWASAARGKFANVGELDVQAAGRQIDLCLDAGVTFVDTANVYSQGASEEIVGRAIRGRRNRITLATKVRFSMGDGPNDAGLSRATSSRRARTACAASAPTGSTSTRSTSGTARRRSRRRSARSTRSSATARSATSAARTTRAGRCPRRSASPRATATSRFVSNQVYYSLQARDAEYEIVPGRDRPGRRPADLEPARRRPALRQVPPRRRGARRLASADRVGRAAGARPGGPLRHRRGAGRDRRGRTTSPPRRSRWPGRSGAPA